MIFKELEKIILDLLGKFQEKVISKNIVEGKAVDHVLLENNKTELHRDGKRKKCLNPLNWL